MSGIKISVIVPVYNAEKYLEETLAALSSQTFREFEAILVDDGSTDASPQIIDRCCREDSRFFALHLTNSGGYNARLAGIKKAKGRYIAFCDSDDLYLPDMLEKMYAQAEKTCADITVCGFIRKDMESGKVLSREMLSFDERFYERPELWDILPVVNSSMWNKLYRAELFEHAVLLDRPPAVAEDGLLNALLYPFVQRMAFVREPLYVYRVHQDSAMSAPSSADIDLLRDALLKTRDCILGQHDSPEIREYLDSMAFIHIGLSMVIRQAQSGENSRKAVRSARLWLEQNFPGYRRAGKTLAWNLRHRMIQQRLLTGRWLFCARLMQPFLFFYRLITRTFGIDIKW